MEIPESSSQGGLIAKLSWCSSQKLDVKQVRDREQVQVTGNALLNRRLPLIGSLFPITGLLITTQQVPGIKYLTIGVLTLFLLVLAGTLTLGRRQWLKLSLG
ncbi:MAG: hypothetical protein AAFQ98_04240 [Bacteroidota bacterium]